MTDEVLADAQGAVGALAGCRALLVGDLVLDRYVYGETVRVSREAPVVIVRKQHVDHRLGAGANTALNLAALGVKTTMVACVGSDNAGGQVLNALADAGVDASGLVQAHTRVTPEKTRILAGSVGTSKQQVLRLDDEPREPLPAAVTQALSERLREYVANCDIVVVSDYGLGTLTPPLVAAICELAREGVPVCVDSRHNLAAYRGVTAVTPNVPEVEALLGQSLGPVGLPPDRAAQMVREKVAAKACLLTQGRDGMTLHDGVEATHVDVVGTRDVTDVTGAGDTVLATFAAAIAAGLGMHNAMLLANCAAGVVVTKVGTAVVTPEVLLRACEQGSVEVQAWAA